VAAFLHLVDPRPTVMDRRVAVLDTCGEHEEWIDQVLTPNLDRAARRPTARWLLARSRSPGAVERLRRSHSMHLSKQVDFPRGAPA
jgi:hypothetical protein